MTAFFDKTIDVSKFDGGGFYYSLDDASDTVRKSDFSKGKYKALTLDIMDGVKNSGDLDAIWNTLGAVQKWVGKETNYLEEILSFFKEQQDIKAVLICGNNDISDIIIIVDDTTKDVVLDYNDFLFDISDNYDEIHDFMVVDEDMLEAVNAMYESQRWIYKRG